MGTAPVRRTTYSEYLALEAETGRKHEFDSGVVTMMGGGSPDHALLAMTFGRLLGNALAGGPCRPYSSDLKVWNADLDQAVYPDVTVICGPVVPAVHDRLAVVNPSLVAEVLSHSTRGRDALVKAPAYRAMPSVQEVLLIDSEAVFVQHFRRGEDGKWVLTETSDLHAWLELHAGGARLSVAELYAGTGLLAEREAAD